MRKYYNNDNVEISGNFTVKLRKNEAAENLIKRFLKKTKKERIVEECLENKKYKKPTTLRREAKHRRELVLKKLREKEQADLVE